MVPGTKPIQPQSVHHSSLEIAVSLFPPDSKSGSSRQVDSRKAITELKIRAKADDGEAIELLLNLSAGHPDLASSKNATEALLEIYGDSATQPEIRTAIEQQALALFEVFFESPSFVSSSNSKQIVMPLSIAPSILYLAGQYAYKSNSHARLNQINERLEGLCFPGGAAASEHKKLLDRGRLTLGEELCRATGRFASIAIHDRAIEIQANGEVSGGSLNTVFSGALREEQPYTVFLNVNNHWVTLVMSHAGEKDQSRQTYDAVLIDTNFRGKGLGEAGRAVWEALKKSSSDRDIRFEQIGGNMQTDTPNACGPLSVMAVGEINRLLAGDSGADMAAIKRCLGEWVSSWGKATSDKRNAAVTAERARMLQAIASSASGWLLQSEILAD